MSPPAERGATRPTPHGGQRRRRAVLASVLLALVSIVPLVLLGRFTTRPFGFDEQWRAEWIGLGPRIVTQLHDVPGPMTAGFIGIEWATMKALPTTELGLRLPMLASLPALAITTFWLARRWMGEPASFLVAALVAVNGSLLVYGVLLKPFVFEAFVAMALLLVWRHVNDPPRPTAAGGGGADDRDGERDGARGGGRWLAYVAMGGLTFFASAALFVLAPLALYDAARLWPAARRREETRPAARRRVGWWLAALGPDLVALALAGAHFVFFLSRQDHLLRERELHPQDEPYWQRFFLPHSGPLDIVSFVYDRMKPAATLLTATYLPPDTTDKYLRDAVPPAPASMVVGALALVFSGLVVWGVWVAARNPSRRVLVVALGGVLVGTLGASFKETWPFGVVRANLVLVPLLYLLAGVGAVDALGRLRAPGLRATAHAAVGIGATAVVVVALVNVRALDERFAAPQFIDRTRDVVRVVRASAGPDDLAVAVLDPDGWRFYSWRYDDVAMDEAGIGRVAGERTLLTDSFTDPAIATFVRSHPAAAHVFLFDLAGVSEEGYAQQQRWLQETGFCPTRRWDFPQTGILTEYGRDQGPCRPPERQDVPPLS